MAPFAGHVRFVLDLKGLGSAADVDLGGGLDGITNPNVAHLCVRLMSHGLRDSRLHMSQIEFVTHKIVRIERFVTGVPKMENNGMASGHASGKRESEKSGHVGFGGSCRQSVLGR